MSDLLALVRQRPRDLLPFEEVRDRLGLRRVVDRGTRDVPLEKIVGTFGRRGEFNRAFLPRSEALRERWEDVRDLAEGVLSLNAFAVFTASCPVMESTTNKVSCGWIACFTL